MHANENDTICQAQISPIESQTTSLVKYKAPYVDGTQHH